MISFLFVACGTMSPGPEQVAEKYLLYLNNKEFDKAKELCTEQSKKMLEKFESLGNLGGGVESGKALIENIKCFIDGDNAVCTFTADGEDKEMLLVKTDGKWLIDFDMDEETPDVSDNSDNEPAAVDTLESEGETKEENKE